MLKWCRQRAENQSCVHLISFVCVEMFNKFELAGSCWTLHLTELNYYTAYHKRVMMMWLPVSLFRTIAETISLCTPRHCGINAKKKEVRSDPPAAPLWKQTHSNTSPLQQLQQHVHQSHHMRATLVISAERKSFFCTILPHFVRLCTHTGPVVPPPPTANCLHP